LSETSEQQQQRLQQQFVKEQTTLTENNNNREILDICMYDREVGRERRARAFFPGVVVDKNRKRNYIDR
jgi:hypothetical protein